MQQPITNDYATADNVCKQIWQQRLLEVSMETQLAMSIIQKPAIKAPVLRVVDFIDFF